LRFMLRPSHISPDREKGQQPGKEGQERRLHWERRVGLCRQADRRARRGGSTGRVVNSPDRRGRRGGSTGRGEWGCVDRRKGGAGEEAPLGEESGAV
jgi:hypothetical protein